MLSPSELDELKSRPGNDCRSVAEKLGVKLRKSGRRIIGPCPLCSPDKRKPDADRFEIKDKGATWLCRWCGGGDVIKLVTLALNCDFRGAVDWLGGTREVDPAIAKKREEEQAAAEAKRAAEANLYRQRARRSGYKIWNEALAPNGTPVEDYLKLRGLELPADGPVRLRYVAQLPFFHGEETDEEGRTWPRAIHRGPGMVAPITDSAGKFIGLHRTYIDLTQPKGKAILRDPKTGEEVKAKSKNLGSVAGGHIHLIGSREPKQIIIGEGIETVLSVWLAMQECGIDISITAFWSSVDLGNLGGPAADRVVHPELVDAGGRARRVPGPDPDMTKPGIDIPQSVIDVIALGDGDSDRVLTECAIHRGAVRWRNAARVVRVAWADQGKDFNDMVRG